MPSFFGPPHASEQEASPVTASSPELGSQASMAFLLAGSEPSPLGEMLKPDSELLGLLEMSDAYRLSSGQECDASNGLPIGFNQLEWEAWMEGSCPQMEGGLQLPLRERALKGDDLLECHRWDEERSAACDARGPSGGSQADGCSLGPEALRASDATLHGNGAAGQESEEATLFAGEASPSLKEVQSCPLQWSAAYLHAVDDLCRQRPGPGSDASAAFCSLPHKRSLGSESSSSCSEPSSDSSESALRSICKSGAGSDSALAAKTEARRSAEAMNMAARSSSPMSMAQSPSHRRRKSSKSVPKRRMPQSSQSRSCQKPVWGHPCREASCSRMFKKPYQEKEHFQATHSGEKAFKCPGCGKSYATSNNLNGHIRRSRCTGLAREQ